MGIAGMVLGIIAVIFAFIPVVGAFVAIPCAVVGLPLAIIGLKRNRREGQGSGMSIAGVVTCSIALVMVIIWVILIAVSSDDSGTRLGDGPFDDRERAEELIEELEELERDLEDAFDSQ